MTTEQQKLFAYWMKVMAKGLQIEASLKLPHA